jgi:ferrous iron transport protein B
LKVLLIGNPNVGKSALFYRLTGVAVHTSNYAGTTVTFTEGKWKLPPISCAHDCAQCPGCMRLAKDTGIVEERIADIVDVPGTYSLEPDAQSERIAVDMIDTADVLINIIDSTNLERNLSLTLDLITYKKPMIAVLNMWDEAHHMGIEINVKKLESELGIPVVTTNARTGEGVLDLAMRLDEAAVPKLHIKDETARWETIGKIVKNTQSLTHRHHTFRERLEDLSMHPVFGLPIALAVLVGMFEIVITLGNLIVDLLAKFFQWAWVPLMMRLYDSTHQMRWIAKIFVGDLIDGQIDLEASMGVLTTGLFVPLGLVLPYLLLFYLILGFLEDWGYLPRMAVLFDRFFHRIGLHGYSVIPIMLATGCNIPGVLALRNLETRRERFITAAIMCTAIPCMAQSAIIFRETGKFGSVYLWLTLISLLTVAVVLGVILNAYSKGSTPSLLAEMPSYRIPSVKMQFKKLWNRLRGFFKEAVPLMMLGILLVQILFLTGVLDILFKIAAPVVTGLWGLPKETVSAMLVGIIRKDAAVALLVPLKLTGPQTITAIVTLVLYFPCVATYTVLARELGLKDLLKVTGIMLASTLIMGILLNLAGAAMPPIAIIGIELLVMAAAVIILNKVSSRREDEII